MPNNINNTTKTRAKFKSNQPTHILNDHGIPIPTTEHIQEVLSGATSTDQLEGKGKGKVKGNVLDKLFVKTINSLL